MQPLHELNQYMQPGYEGYLDHPVPTVAELLRDAGYRTPFAGQWHVALFPLGRNRAAARGGLTAARNPPDHQEPFLTRSYRRNASSRSSA
nr:sulfatase-like hydrolase/transferase [Dietzia cinnamea]